MKRTFKQVKKDFYLIASYYNVDINYLEKNSIIQKEINRVRRDMNFKIEKLMKLIK
jgi:hypothetical protein